MSLIPGICALEKTPCSVDGHVHAGQRGGHLANTRLVPGHLRGAESFSVSELIGGWLDFPDAACGLGRALVSGFSLPFNLSLMVEPFSYGCFHFV